MLWFCKKILALLNYIPNWMRRGINAGLIWLFSSCAMSFFNRLEMTKHQKFSVVNRNEN